MKKFIELIGYDDIGSMKRRNIVNSALIREVFLDRMTNRSVTVIHEHPEHKDRIVVHREYFTSIMDAESRYRNILLALDADTSLNHANRMKLITSNRAEEMKNGDVK